MVAYGSDLGFADATWMVNGNVFDTSVPFSVCVFGFYRFGFHPLLKTFQHANEAQQAFSVVCSPTLHNALPAVEALHAGWTKATSKDKYKPFHTALEAAADKLEEYYDKMAVFNAHIISMGKAILFP